ncbi:hypothetical protein FHW84_002565 [Dyella sp. SG562]|uniref:hypothetical protein n=1 Tax=Dyella sp. SG562 TaxID=2587017 RepID=UPI00141D7CBA|nr:hypothetical protein [Dyella sp. SG562]NII73980.1 hypothetical protein [Dyella sp. SG562]
MKLHPGLVIRINNVVAAAVSSENFNILSVRIQGDVISPEIAILDVTGGYYGDPGETKHLIWVHNRELSASDEVEIQFQDIAASSYAGKAIEEIYPKEDAPTDGQPLDMAELAGYLREQPRLRRGFDLHVRVSEADPQIFSTRGQDYSFFVSIMWDWKSIDSAKLSVTSTTIQNVVEQKPGTQYLRRRLGSGQSVHIRIVGQ